METHTEAMETRTWDPLLTLREVAELIRRPEAQLRWMRHNGTGPRSGKLAGRVMYRQSDVERWISDAFEGSVAS